VASDRLRDALAQHAGVDAQWSRRGGRRDDDETPESLEISRAASLNGLLATPATWASTVVLADQGMRARSLTQLQRQAGNRAAATMLARVQRCGGQVHEGCACAEAGGRGGDAEAGRWAAGVPVQRQPSSDEPAPADQTRAGAQGADPWAGPASTTPSGATPSRAAAGTPTTGSGTAGPVITAERVSDADFARLTGLPGDTLPEGVLVKDLDAMSGAVQGAPADLLPPGWRRTPVPAS
jgi:hypothetical protein